MLFFCFVGPGAPQAAHHRHAGQRRAVLPGAVQYVLGPQLSQPQPLEHPADAGQEGGARVRSGGLLRHRDGAHTD